MISQARISLITSLHHKKYRKENNLFVIEGEKLVEEALKRNCKVDFIVARPDWIDNNEQISQHFNGEIVSADEKVFKKISSLSSPASVLAVLQIPKDRAIMMKGVIPVFDDIRDPGNLGTIIRTAEWFGFDQIICSKSSVDCYNPKVVQASMGSLFSVDVHYVDIVEMISANPKMKVVAATADAKSNITEMELKQDAFMVMGNESSGVSKEVLQLTQEQYKIKGGDAITESLNLAIATAIVLFQLSTKK